MQIIVNNRLLDLSCTRVMGILNVTPDSFYDGGKYNRLSAAIDHTAKMIASGATLIDIGGESTRPGSDPINDDEETTRVVPVVKAIAQRFDIVISVNTSKAIVMRESASAGAHLINDIRSLSEPMALEAAAASQLPICLMHMQGKPRTMQQAPRYNDVLKAVYTYFIQQIARCEAAGIKRNRLILDPGFGFGKEFIHNYRLLARLSFLHNFGLPILVGMSRKSMIGNNLYPDQRLIGSVACAVIAALQGAHIVRVHDVLPTVEALLVVEATIAAKETYFL